MIFSIASKATPLPTANPLTWNLEWSNLKNVWEIELTFSLIAPISIEEKCERTIFFVRLVLSPSQREAITHLDSDFYADESALNRYRRSLFNYSQPKIEAHCEPHRKEKALKERVG
jgi:hypothetical protein